MDFSLQCWKNLFGKSKKKFRKHVIFYDVFGNFYYADFEEGPGYCYASPLWLPSFMKNELLMGQISGLILCTETNFHTTDEKASRKNKSFSAQSINEAVQQN